MQPLSNYSSTRTGHSFRGKVQESDQGSLFVIQPKDILNGKLGNPIAIEKHSVESFQRHLLNKGDLLIGNKGVKFSTYVFDEDIEAIASSSFFIIAPNKNLLLPEYLHWYLNQPEATTYLQQSTTGSTILSLRKTALDNLPVPVPPLGKQRHIINLLKAVEDEKLILNRLVEKRNSFIESHIWELINEIK